MSASNRVDVVVADGEPMAGLGDLADVVGEQVEAVDVAPDPARRIIVIAPTKHAGHKHADVLGIEPAAIVTPRSPYGARGMVADEIVEAEGLTAEEREALTIEVAPALATVGAE